MTDVDLVCINLYADSRVLITIRSNMFSVPLFLISLKSLKVIQA